MRYVFCSILIAMIGCSHAKPGGGGGNNSDDAGGQLVDAATPAGDHDQGGGGDLAMPNDNQNADAGNGTNSDAGCHCVTPPTTCHAKVGTCGAAGCEYAFIDGALCDDGDPCTDDDTCSDGACAGTPTSCDAPPVAECTNGSTLRTYDPVGTCNGGLCVYTKHSIACDSGCSGQSCVGGNSCSGVTCDMPPSACYVASGACSTDTGTCHYDFNNAATCNDGNACTHDDACENGVCKGVPVACNAPPAATCQDTNTLRLSDSVGACGGSGTCTYGYSFMTCANGCASGACAATGWVKLDSGVTAGLHAVWGSSASAVWAFGDAGTIIYYNGTSWQTKSTPTETSGVVMYDAHGTSASNVFAIGSGKLIHYNGTKWQFVATVSVGASEHQEAVYAVGDNDCFVYGAGAGGGVLYRVTNGTATQVATTGDLYYDAFYPNTGLRVFSPTDILVSSTTKIYHFDGTKFTAFETSATAEGASHLFATSDSNVIAMNQTDLRSWNGTSFDKYVSGVAGGILAGVAGSSTSHLYVVGYHTGGGDMLFFDGTGLSKVSLPAGTQGLNAVWAAPTGEIFAVGDSGTIVKGP